MSIKEGRDYLLLVWKEPKTKRRYIVGELSRNGQFEFLYGYEVHKAIAAGFELLIAFPDINTVYKNDHLFPVFASRLPDPKRKDIEAILEKYGLTEYDSYKLLKSSGAKLPIDKLEFIDPIFYFESGKEVRRFFIAGTGFCLGCKGEICDKSIEVKLHEELKLIPEPENEHDRYAVKITNEKGTLGYLPRYYSEGISKLSTSNASITCKVIGVNKDNMCLECIQVELSIHK
jgi:HIRAN domain.